MNCLHTSNRVRYGEASRPLTLMRLCLPGRLGLVTPVRCIRRLVSRLLRPNTITYFVISAAS
jgi:hypothetical protein